MGDKSAISWCDATWNPTTGCDRVSPGCAHCYALDYAARLKGMGQAGYQTDGDPRTSGPGFGLALHRERLDIPLRWRKPRLIFVNSMSDLFHELVPDDFLDEVFGIMAACRYGRHGGPGHTFQVLTKRPERMRAYLSTDRRMAWARVASRFEDPDPLGDQIAYGPQVLPNVWLGTSVENQTWAERRIPELLATPAAVRFLSCEPLLGPVDLTAIPRTRAEGWMRPLDGRFNRIDWVIAGGESGADHRPMDPAWARSLRDRCAAADVPFFFKQWGGARAGGEALLDGRQHHAMPAVGI